MTCIYNTKLLRIIDDLYLLQSYKILMICIYNTKDYWWFVIITILQDFDDLYF